MRGRDAGGEEVPRDSRATVHIRARAVQSGRPAVESRMLERSAPLARGGLRMYYI